MALPNRYKPDARECALLLLGLIEERGKDRTGRMTRVRLSEVTLKDLWNRGVLSDAFLRDVHDWLLTAGWALFDSGKTFAAVHTSAVENWPRASSMQLKSVVQKVKAGKFSFEDLEHLMTIEERGRKARDDTDE